MAVLINADHSKGGEKLLFAINPTMKDAKIELGQEVAKAGAWRHVADQDRFIQPGSRAATLKVDSALDVPALGCGLWHCGT